MARHTRSTARAAWVASIVLGAAALMLTGCTGTAAPPATTPASPPPSGTSATPSASATAIAELVPDGTAEENLPVFARVTQSVWAGSHRAEGRAYIDALVAVGFDKGAMQVTEDTSTVGNPAESIQFSVLWKDEQCLVGQVGPATGRPVTRVLPVLGDGRCLLGKTRPIDW